VAQSLDVSTVVELQQLFGARRLAGTEAVVREPAENPRKVRDGGVANDLQRVMVPKSGAPKGLAADENRQRQGMTRIDRAHCLNIVHASASERG
jgi:hypothetical protein